MGGSSRSQVVGYRYRMAVHLAVCYGPVDRIIRFLAGDREAWSGNRTASGEIAINAPQLFGGDEREGGLRGTLQVMMGEESQTLPALVAGMLPSPSPAFRGVFSLFYDGLISANNPYVKPMAPQLTRILKGWHGGECWYPETAPVPIEAAADSPLVTYVLGYTGEAISIVVPPGCASIPIAGWGAGGGGSIGAGVEQFPGEGAGGGYSSATVPVTPGETLTLIVGEGGAPNGDATFGGGGKAGRSGSVDDGVYRAGGAGGGRTALLRGTTVLWAAPGGGGAGTAYTPGAAGGGANGGDASAPGDGGGQGGTPSDGGEGGTWDGAGSWTPGGSGNDTAGGGGANFRVGDIGDVDHGGGGGGGGRQGGGGGAAGDLTGGGGGGGSGLGDVLLAGSAQTPGGTDAPGYQPGIGVGGDAAQTGGHGLALVSLPQVLEAMNPSHIIYQCLTDPEWGMGYPTAVVDEPSFAAAADTLFAEGLGLCLLWNQQEELDSFIQHVLDHCGGILYSDPKTGRFKLKLLRADYDAEDLEVFDESTVQLESFQRVGYGETVNEITVVYRDVFTNKDTPVTVQDLANIQAQGGVVSKTVQYPGLPTGGLAARIAQRDLISLSTPLAKVRLKANRAAWSKYPGEVFKLTWSTHGLAEVIFRVLTVNTGELTDGAVTIEAVEDVFGLPASSYVAQEPSGWVEPETGPVPIARQAVAEIPYWTLVRELSAADMDYVDQDAAFFAPMAARPSSLSLSFSTYSKVGASPYSQTGSGSFVPAAELAGAVDQQATTLPLASAIDVDRVAEGDLVIVGTGSAAEWMLVVAIDVDVLELTVSRGVLDTTPRVHEAGAPVFFTDAGDSEDTTERATGEVVDFKLAPTSTGGTLDFNLATVLTSEAAGQRQYRPYAPGHVLINGQAWPESISADLSITWAHRDRLAQTAYVVEQGESSIGPEVGTTYSGYAYDDDTDALITSSSGVTGTSWTPLIPGAYRLRIEIEAVRDGLSSWQRQVRVFDYVGEDARATEAGDVRITEADTSRTQE